MTAYFIIDQLICQGVKHFCIAPGSRCTPLVLSAIKRKEINLHVHFDERGLGFFALGIAKGLKEPVCVIVTSGTAVANLLPSIMEAHHTAIPLIFLTADRPASLRNCGSNQTTDQVKIFSQFLRFEQDIYPNMDEKACRRFAFQSYFYASLQNPGPVQLNCQFDEPLHIIPLESIGKKIDIPKSSYSIEPINCPFAKGLILLGEMDDPSPILQLAEKLKWPVIADILSNARIHPTNEQIVFHDFFEKPFPEIVLHFGGRFTSKRLLEWLGKTTCEITHISPLITHQDPIHKITTKVICDFDEFCKKFEAKTDSTWLETWKSLDIAITLPTSETLTEAHAMQMMQSLDVSDFSIFLANGMPIRDADHFFFPKKCLKFFGNRGVSGIDGNIATIAGLAEISPVFAIIGDQTALYDLNSIALLRKSKHPCIVVISNNFGGGIFHHLPIKNHDDFERFWVNAHDLKFDKIASMFSIEYFEFKDIQKALKQKHSCIVELHTNRIENHKVLSCLAKP